MELEEASKHASEDKTELASPEEAQNANGKGGEPKEEDQETNGASTKVDDRVQASEKTENIIKETKEANNESPKQDRSRHDRPSKKVREGQRWNDRNDRNNRGRGNYHKQSDRPYKRNNKSDLTSQQESNDPVAIRKQVEFYFSDSNLLTDKFLFTKVEGHENIPVPISTIHSFKRMRHFQPLSAVVDALKESTFLNIVEDDTCIQRKEPLPEGLVGKPMVEIQKVHEDKTMARSIYAKGFGEEEPSTQFDIEAFFSQHGSTSSVRLRRQLDATFKGSVFVEFDSEETQKAFLALDPKPKWQGKELQIKSKKQYCDDKVDDIAAGRVRPNSQDRSSFKGARDGRNERNGGRDRRGRDDDDNDDDRDWRVRREADRKSGFRDRRGGKHKGFGSSGRDRDRGGRGRDWAGRDVPKGKASTPDSGDSIRSRSTSSTPAETPNKDKAVKDEENTPDTSMGPPPPVPVSTAGLETTDAGSKKRARDDDREEEEQGSAKKVDTKTGES